MYHIYQFINKIIVLPSLIIIIITYAFDGAFDGYKIRLNSMRHLRHLLVEILFLEAKMKKKKIMEKEAMRQPPANSSK